jgi:hypothetical protein
MRPSRCFIGMCSLCSFNRICKWRYDLRRMIFDDYSANFWPRGFSAQLVLCPAMEVCPTGAGLLSSLVEALGRRDNLLTNFPVRPCKYTKR